MLNVSSLAAGESDAATIDLPGAELNDAVILGLPAGVAPELAVSAFVSAPNVVTVQLVNVQGTAAAAVDAFFRVTIVRA